MDNCLPKACVSSSRSHAQGVGSRCELCCELGRSSCGISQNKAFLEQEKRKEREKFVYSLEEGTFHVMKFAYMNLRNNFYIWQVPSICKPDTDRYNLITRKVCSLHPVFHLLEVYFCNFCLSVIWKEIINAISAIKLHKEDTMMVHVTLSPEMTPELFLCLLFSWSSFLLHATREHNVPYYIYSFS
jgi:hypothetical protein